MTVISSLLLRVTLTTYLRTCLNLFLLIERTLQIQKCINDLYLQDTVINHKLVSIRENEEIIPLDVTTTEIHHHNEEIHLLHEAPQLHQITIRSKKWLTRTKFTLLEWTLVNFPRLTSSANMCMNNIRKLYKMFSYSERKFLQQMLTYPFLLHNQVSSMRKLQKIYHMQATDPPHILDSLIVEKLDVFVQVPH